MEDQIQAQPGQSASPFNVTPRPKNWLIESILVTIFCCQIFGIISIVYAASVNSKFDSGDYAGAQRASQDAGKWVKWAFFSGILIILACAVLFGLGIFSAAFMGTDYN